MKWERQEAGWYQAPEADHIAVAKERDGRWHTYVERTAPPGDTTHRTMRRATKAAERLWRRRKR